MDGDYNLMRVVKAPDLTYGVLLNPDGYPVCLMLERPWKDNQTGISCIPEGRYLAQRYNSPTKGEVWELQNTGPRSNIEIHPANLVSELEGCLAPGREFGSINGIHAIMGSRLAFMDLENSTGNKDFWLNITDNTTNGE